MRDCLLFGDSTVVERSPKMFNNERLFTIQWLLFGDSTVVHTLSGFLIATFKKRPHIAFYRYFFSNFVYQTDAFALLFISLIAEVASKCLLLLLHYCS